MYLIRPEYPLHFLLINIPIYQFKNYIKKKETIHMNIKIPYKNVDSKNIIKKK